MTIPFTVSWIEIINTIVLAVTAGIIAWYTVETHRLRRETVRQNELQLRPYLVPSFSEHQDGYKLALKNVGRGTATKICIDSVVINLTDPVVQWKYEFSTIDWLECGLSGDPKVWCNGRATNSINILHAPQVNRFQISDANGDRQGGSPWTLRVLFDDVEGGRYLQEFDITPSERPEPSNILARPIRRMPPDFGFEPISQQS